MRRVGGEEEEVGGGKGSLVVNAAHRGPSLQGPQSACGVWRAQGGEQKHARGEGGAGRGGTLTFLGQG